MPVAIYGLPEVTDSNSTSADAEPVSVAAEGTATAGSPSELPPDTDAPLTAAVPVESITANAVMMPSAEMLAEASGGPESIDEGTVAQISQAVGDILADALAGGSGNQAVIESALSQLSAHGIPGLDTLATLDGGGVSAWDGTGVAAFAPIGNVFSMEAMMLHQDAAPAANS